MSAVRDLFPKTDRDGEVAPLNGHAWMGFIANSPVDFSDRVFVILPDFSADLQFGPCRWQSRDSTTRPKRGDKALFMFDNNREGWVVAWWPSEYDAIGSG